MPVGSKVIAGVGVIICLGLTSMVIGNSARADASLQQPIPLPGQSSLVSRASIELLTNGGFEVDVDTDNLPDGWLQKNTATPKSDKLKCDQPANNFNPHSGLCAFRFRGNSDGTRSNLQQTLTDTSELVDGVTVVFSAYLKPVSQPPGSTIGKAQVKYSDGSRQTFKLSVPANSLIPLNMSMREAGRDITAYAHIRDQQTINIPEGAGISSVKIKLVQNLASGKFLVDDASFAIIDLPPATKLVASDGAYQDTFGSTVALSNNGAIALVGAPFHTIGANAYQGSAYIFTRDGDTWTEKTKLLPDDGKAQALFGRAVALSSDGGTTIVGATESGIGPGAAYIFTLNGDNWTQQAKLIASDEELHPHTNFGSAAVLSDDGNIAVVSAIGYGGDPSYNRGVVYIFTRNGTVWTEQAKLIPSDPGHNAYFGEQLALSNDSKVLLIGTRYHVAAYIFTESDGVWSEQTKLVPPDGEIAANGRFGTAVALNGDGNLALIGSYGGEHVGNVHPGAVYVFSGSGSVWTQQTKLTASDGQGDDRFGYSVALSNDGSIALIGAMKDGVGANFAQGSAYVFTNDGSVWAEQVRITASDGSTGDVVGWSVALADDGSIGLVGAPGDFWDEIDYQGSAYSFDFNQP